jgi:hypothetical protein
LIAICFLRAIRCFFVVPTTLGAYFSYTDPVCFEIILVFVNNYTGHSKYYLILGQDRAEKGGGEREDYLSLYIYIP